MEAGNIQISLNTLSFNKVTNLYIFWPGKQDFHKLINDLLETPIETEHGITDYGLVLSTRNSPSGLAGFSDLFAPSNCIVLIHVLKPMGRTYTGSYIHPNILLCVVMIIMKLLSINKPLVRNPPRPASV